MDAYFEYNKIKMGLVDAPKRTFISRYENYYYNNVMLFGLKNAYATYQRLMDTVFWKQIGRNLELYIDSMIMKILEGESHIEDLEYILGLVRNYSTHLNPSKCSFGV